MKETVKKYYYKCPSKLGYLEIILDAKEKIISCVFSVDKVGTSLRGPSKNALDNYFKNKKSLPKGLISKKIQGTNFQKKIWETICGVDFGKTITYTDMSIKSGKERAARAAGTACGKNPVALFIPCHRVVRKQGEDYGYSWGPERKKWLLEFEKIN